METFTREGAQTAMVATLAPGPTDTEHTVSTLRTVCMLAGTEGEISIAPYRRPELLNIDLTRLCFTPPGEVLEKKSHDN